jgi:hypothetical protein
MELLSSQSCKGVDLVMNWWYKIYISKTIYGFYVSLRSTRMTAASCQDDKIFQND